MFIGRVGSGVVEGVDRQGDPAFRVSMRLNEPFSVVAVIILHGRCSESPTYGPARKDSHRARGVERLFLALPPRRPS